MLRSSLTAAALIATAALAIGCGEEEVDPPARDVPGEIARSIAGHCKQAPVEARFPSDQAHAEFRELAEGSMLILCPGTPRTGTQANRSAYARFPSPEAMQRAIASVDLPPTVRENLCLTETEAFTTDFWGSVPTCKKLGGRGRKVRQPPPPSAISHRTFVAGCGNTSYLAFKPSSWSNGCTAGADNLRVVNWRRYSEHEAFGTGTTGLRGPCATGANPDEICKGQDAYYTAPATLLLYEPRECSDQGSVVTYFAQARFRFYARADNPFGYPEGWRSRVLRALDGICNVIGPEISG